MSKLSKVKNERDELDEIKCPLCGEVDVIGAWDMFTMQRCKNRLQKRDYISLKKKSAYMKANDTYYVCPHCEEYVAGYLLK